MSSTDPIENTIRHIGFREAYQRAQEIYQDNDLLQSGEINMTNVELATLVTGLSVLCAFNNFSHWTEGNQEDSVQGFLINTEERWDKQINVLRDDPGDLSIGLTPSALNRIVKMLELHLSLMRDFHKAGIEGLKQERQSES